MHKSLPKVSIIIPAYESWETVAGSLSALRTQTYPDFEVIVVDSSPSNRTREIVESNFHEVRIIQSKVRLKPHEARNLGVESARGEVLVFTDPDVYPRNDWLELLLRELTNRDGAAVGAVGCYGNKWLDQGIHIAKYYCWLPGSGLGEAAGSHTASLACTREIWSAFGGFPEFWSGDAAFGWWLTSRGYECKFASKAVVQHHHLASWWPFLHERLFRGYDLTLCRAAWWRWSRRRLMLQLGATCCGIRLARTLFLIARSSHRSGWAGTYFRTLPVILSGIAAFQIGEMRAIWGLFWKGKTGRG